MNEKLKLKFPIIEKGRNLSSGQRQLLSLSRVLLEKKNIIVLGLKIKNFKNFILIFN